MAQKLSKKYTLSINGLITVCDDGNIDSASLYNDRECLKTIL